MPVLQSMAQAAHRLPEGRVKSRAGRLTAFALARLGAEPIVEVRLRDGTLMALDARGRTEGSAVWNGVFDPATIAILKACLPAGGHLLDVGANVGLIAIPLARHLAATGGAVTAIEPVAANAERLRRSACLNDLQLPVMQCALSDRPGEVVMTRETSFGATSGNAVMGSAAPARGEVTTVPATTMDLLAQSGRIGRVDCIKVDIEGAEVLFLHGALEYLKDAQPCIFGEFHSGLMPAFGHTFLDVADALQPLGYRFLAFGVGGAAYEVEPRVGLGNVLAVPDYRFTAVLKELLALAALGHI